jgi:uncharacterized membrane protein YbhN (UPF0104 family)
LSRRAWRALALAIGLAVGAAVLWQLMRDRAALADLLAGRRPGDLWPLALAWLVQTAGWLLVVDTWRRILARLGGSGPFRLHLRIHTTSGLASLLPGSIWQPASRLADYRAAGVPARAVGAAMAVEWLLLGLAGLAVYALAAPFARLGPAVGLVALLVAAGLAGAVLYPPVHNRFLGPIAARFGDGRPWPRLGRAELAGWLAREAVVLALAGLGLYLLMAALGVGGSVADALAVTGLTLAFANLMAWLPATALLKDAGMVALLTPVYGGAAGVALAVVVAWRLWLTAVQLSWVVLATVAWRGRGRDGTLEPAEPAERVERAELNERGAETGGREGAWSA